MSQLAHLELCACVKVSDAGVKQIGMLAARQVKAFDKWEAAGGSGGGGGPPTLLRVLDLGGLARLSDSGLQKLTARARGLTTLDLRGCRCGCDHLHTLQTLRCPVPAPQSAVGRWSVRRPRGHHRGAAHRRGAEGPAPLHAAAAEGDAALVRRRDRRRGEAGHGGAPRARDRAMSTARGGSVLAGRLCSGSSAGGGRPGRARGARRGASGPAHRAGAQPWAQLCGGPRRAARPDRGRYSRRAAPTLEG